MSLKLTDEVSVRIKESGGKLGYFPVTDFNDLISSEESGRLDTLESQVGDYDPDITSSTITDDLEQVQEDVLDLQTTTEIAKEGAPITETAPAVLVTGLGENWEIRWEAVTAGADGNDLTLRIGNGIGINLPIDVTVDDTDITINLATDAGGDPDDAENTATNVIAAVNEDAIAGLLVQGTLTGGGGVVAIESAANFTDGIDITEGVAGEVRYDSKNIYVSTDVSTAAVSYWKKADLSLPGISVLDLSAATEDYQISAASQTVVLVNNHATAVDLLLPSAAVAMVGSKITISNQDNASVDVAPYSTNTINGANAAITIATTESATLLCYETGAWAVI